MIIRYLWQEPSNIKNSVNKTIELFTWSTVDLLDSTGERLVTAYPNLYEELNQVWLYICSNPQTKNLISFSYSVEQVLSLSRRYVEGTAILDWVSVIVKAVINIDNGTVIDNLEAVSLYGRESVLEHSSWIEATIQSGSLVGWDLEVVICADFQPPAIAAQTLTFFWPSAVNKDANGVYTLSFSNAWPDTSTDTVITLPLPAWVDYVSDNWGWVENAWVVTWDLWDYNAGQDITISLTLNFTTGWSKSLQATLTDSLIASNDIVRTINTNVLFADLELGISWSTTPEYSDSFSQTVLVTNNWPTLANGTEVTIVLPIWIDWVSGSGWSYNAWTRTATKTIWTLTNGWTDSSTINLIWADIWTFQIEWEVTATTPEWNPLDNTVDRNITVENKNIDSSLTGWVDENDILTQFAVNFNTQLPFPNPTYYTSWDYKVSIEFPLWTQYSDLIQNNEVEYPLWDIDNEVRNAWTSTATWDMTPKSASLWLGSPYLNWPLNYYAWDVIFTLLVNIPFNDINLVNNVSITNIPATGSLNTTVITDDTYDLSTIIDTNLWGTLVYTLDWTNTIAWVSIVWDILTVTAWDKTGLLAINVSNWVDSVVVNQTDITNLYEIRMDILNPTSVTNISNVSIVLNNQSESPNLTLNYASLWWTLYRVGYINTANEYWPWVIAWPNGLTWTLITDQWNTTFQLSWSPSENSGVISMNVIYGTLGEPSGEPSGEP